MNGSFSAIGYEGRQPTAPIFFLPYLGLFQLVILLELSVQGLTHTLFQPVPLIGSLFPLSALVFGISLVLIIGQRLFKKSPSPITVEYSDMRDSGGSLALTYETKGGKFRKSLLVGKVDRFPGVPLERVEVAILSKVKGTNASMRIYFSKPRIYLELGFTSDEEMNRVYQLLK